MSGPRPKSDARVTGALEQRVVVLARFGRDAQVLRDILAAGGVQNVLAADEDELVASLEEGAAALLITGESLSSAALDKLHVALDEQPSWSDLTVLLLADEQGLSPRRAPQLARLARERNVVVLSRPLAAISLISALHAALLGRRRQYEVRDLLEREREARRQAEAATKLKDQFLATVSHELRTPLSAITIWASLLETGQLHGEQARTAVLNITASAEAQSRLIDDLLDVSRLQAGTLRIDLQLQPLRPVLMAALAMVRPSAEAKGVHLPAQVECHERVLIDADRGQQIFWNLIKNAVQFTPVGGAVKVDVQRQEAGVCVAISDSGEGIEPGFLPHVFDAFRQADASIAQRQGGLGLGLTIVKQLVDQHGGTISAASEGPGRGATFVVCLPLSHLR